MGVVRLVLHCCLVMRMVGIPGSVFSSTVSHACMAVAACRENYGPDADSWEPAVSWGDHAWVCDSVVNGGGGLVGSGEPTMSGVGECILT